MTTRRDFLFALGATAALPLVARAGERVDALAGTTGPSAARDDLRANPLAGVGVQLYMLRTAMRADPEGTIARIAKIGYTEIEWWGNWQRTPAQVRALLDAHKLRAPAAHVDPKELAPDRIGALLDTAATIGHSTLIVAWSGPDTRKTLDDWKRFAGTFSVAGETAAKYGIRVGYHNHDMEFQRVEGVTYLDHFIAASDPRYVDIELDCFWAYKAGHDPVALLTQHKQRITMLHLKDSSGAPTHQQRDIGAGAIDWKPVLATALANRVTNVYVERDDPADAWASAESGRAHLRTLGF